MKSKLSKKFAVGLFLIIALIQVRVLKFANQVDVAWVEPPREVPGKWNPELFQAFTSGQLASAVDWLVLRFLSDPAYAHVTQGAHAAAFYDIDLATDLDPAFYDLYVHGSGFLAVVRNDIEGSLKILEKGERFRTEKLGGYPSEFQQNHWPQPWSVPFVMGYVHLFEKQNLPAAVKSFEAAASYPESPGFLKHMVQRFRDPNQFLDNAIRVVDVMLAGTQNRETIERLSRHRQDLGVARFISLINRHFDEFVRARAGRTRTELWPIFRQEAGVPPRDPVGGELSLDEKGKIITSTPIRYTLGIAPP